MPVYDLDRLLKLRVVAFISARGDQDRHCETRSTRETREELPTEPLLEKGDYLSCLGYVFMKFK